MNIQARSWRLQRDEKISTVKLWRKKKPAILQKPSANQIEVCLFGSGAEIIKITIIMRSNEIDEFRIRYIGQAPLSIHCCFFFFADFVSVFCARSRLTIFFFSFFHKNALMTIASVTMSAIAVRKMIWCRIKKIIYDCVYNFHFSLPLNEEIGRHFVGGECKLVKSTPKEMVSEINFFVAWYFHFCLFVSPCTW